MKAAGPPGRRQRRAASVSKLDARHPRQGFPLPMPVLAGGALLAAMLLIDNLANVLLLIFAGLLFGIFLHGLADLLSRHSGLPLPLSLALVLLAMLTLLGVGFAVLGVEAASQLEQLGPRLQEAWEQMRARFKLYDWSRVLLSERNLRTLLPDRELWLPRIGGLFSNTIGLLAGMVVVLFIGLYGAATPRVYRNGLLQMLPPAGRPRVVRRLDRLVATLRSWLLGTFVRMSLVGVAVTAGLWLLDVPLALALGLIAFALDFVPYLGPVIAACPALVVALAVSPSTAMSVVLLYVVIQAAENYVLSPLIDFRSVHLPPVATISAQLVFGALFGALGVLFATPLAASLLVVLRREETVARRDGGKAVA